MILLFCRVNPKCSKFSGQKLRCHCPSRITLQTSQKVKFLVFKGVSNNITINDFKELLDFNKINHAEAERMKSKRSGKDLPFIKIKCDNPKQAEALIPGDLYARKQA